MALKTPEYLQTQKYTALRDRLTFAHGGVLQAGVWDSGDFKVTQRAAGGAGMFVDVAAGFALVPANQTGNAGLYHVENDALFTQAVANADSNPRLDQVVVQVNDTTHGSGSTDVPNFAVVKGTPIVQASPTLDNMETSRAPLPAGCLRIADVLVGANVTSITSTNIRDRRPWARGFHYRPASAAATTIGSAGFAAKPPTVFFESGANPIVITLSAYVSNNNATADSIGTQFTLDGTTVLSIFRSIVAGGDGDISATLPTSTTAGRHSLAVDAVRKSGVGTYVTSSLFISVDEWPETLNTASQ